MVLKNWKNQITVDKPTGFFPENRRIIPSGELCGSLKFLKIKCSWCFFDSEFFQKNGNSFDSFKIVK
jgi:hypothetical protein